MTRAAAVSRDESGAGQTAQIGAAAAGTGGTDEAETGTGGATGALTELTRLPWCQTASRPIFDGFVEMMKPEGFEMRARGRDRVVLR